jgi:hypothetical protein
LQKRSSEATSCCPHHPRSRPRPTRATPAWQDRAEKSDQAAAPLASSVLPAPGGPRGVSYRIAEARPDWSSRCAGCSIFGPWHRTEHYERGRVAGSAQGRSGAGGAGSRGSVCSFWLVPRLCSAFGSCRVGAMRTTKCCSSGSRLRTSQAFALPAESLRLSAALALRAATWLIRPCGAI